VERGHGAVANAIRAMLLGVNLPMKFWSHAFHCWLHIDNSFPLKDEGHSPHFMVTGKKDNFSSYTTFGCGVWVRPSGRRAAKCAHNSCKGTFLGFLSNTDKNIVWCNPETDRVKIAKHAHFNEGMNDLPPDLVPPNVVQLQRTQDGQPLPAETQETSVQQFTFTLNPFSHALTKGITITCDDPTFGITMVYDKLKNQACVVYVKRNSSAANMFSSLKATLRKIKGAYITNVNGKPVFTKEDAISALRQL